MDPANDSNPFLNDAELQSIFRQELEQRAANLAAGASRLDNGDSQDTSQDTAFTDLARDAHTIKGNAGVMGFQEIASMARVMESIWKELDQGTIEATDQLSRDLGEAAELVPRLLEPTAVDVARAMALMTKLQTYHEGDAARLAAASGHPSAGSAPPPAPPRPASGNGPSRPKPRPDSELFVDREPTAGDGQVGHRSEEPADPLPLGREDLGGLISSLERRIIGTSTRVETGKLYRIINEISEARLDAEALSESGKRMSSGSKGVMQSEFIATWQSAIAALHVTMADLQERALELAATPLKEVTDTFPQLVRYLSRRTGKEVRFEVDGVNADVDRQIADHLREPLRHLVVNAVDHGVEPPDVRVAADKPPSATVAIRATVVDNRLQITVEDDGRGIDWDRVAIVALERGLLEGEPSEAELSRLLFLPDFSTVEEPSDMSGDGTGLAAVAELAEMLNGGMTIESSKGQGTSIVLTLPASWALQDVVLLSAENKKWGIPAAAVLTTMTVSAADIRPGDTRMELVYQGHQNIPISSFAAAVGLPEVEAVEEVIVLSTRVGPVAVTVPAIVGRRQVVVKGLGPLLSGVPHLTGAALLGGGDVVVIVEPNRLGERVRTVPSPITTRARVLIVDDSIGVRQLVSAALTSHGFETIVAAEAEEALRKLDGEDYDALVVDYAMPGRSGVDLVEAVRKKSISIPIVMVSGVASAEDQAAAWSAGVDAYLDKFDLRKGVLASTLHSLVDLRSSQPTDERP